mgnify:CR=1 FL=1
MKTVILDKCTVTNGDIDFSELLGIGDTECFDLLPESDIARVLRDADAVICNKAQIDRKIIESCPKLKYIGLFATGYNNIDTEAAKEHGICVCNVPGYSTDAVAQHTFSFILALSGSLCDYTASSSNGDWVRSKTFTYFPFPISELAGKALGIFGYGSIGRTVAEIGRAFKMNIIVCTRSKPTDTNVELVSKEELFSRSDFLTLHAPLTKETEKIVNTETLSLMKKSAYLINTARGGCVDEKALADALNGGKIAGAGIDVLTVEPMCGNNPLLTAKNCLVTPHIAWAPKETRKRLIALVAKNLRAFKNGKPINVVNK